MALEHFAAGADRRRGDRRRDGPDPPLGVYAAMLREQDGRWIIPAVLRGSRERSTSICWRAPSPGPARPSHARPGLQRHQWRRLHLGECLAAIADALEVNQHHVPLSISDRISGSITNGAVANTMIAPTWTFRRPVVSSIADCSPCATARPAGLHDGLDGVEVDQAGFTEMMDTEVMFRKWSGRRGRTGCCPGCGLRSEPRLHRLARLDGVAAGVGLDVAPAYHRAVATSFFSFTRCARPIGGAPHGEARRKPASAFPRPCSRLRRRAFLQPLDFSWRPRRHPSGTPSAVPVGSPRSTAAAAEMPSSSPIM